jgi:hypothetical protein
VLGYWRKIMDSNSIFIAFSQIALGLAGFSSILVALSGSHNRWVPIDSFRIKSMLSTSLMATFVSLVPILLTFFAIEEKNKWYISLTILAIMNLIGCTFAFLGYRKLSPLDREALNKKIFLSGLSIIFVFCFIQLVVASIYLDQAPGIFFLGLILDLLVCVIFVVRFLFSRTEA